MNGRLKIILPLALLFAGSHVASAQQAPEQRKGAIKRHQKKAKQLDRQSNRLEKRADRLDKRADRAVRKGSTIAPHTPQAVAKQDKLNKKAQRWNRQSEIAARKSQKKETRAERQKRIAARKVNRKQNRAERAQSKREARREWVRGVTKEQNNPAMKQEFARHARVVARLQRVQEVAVEQKRFDTMDKAQGMLDREHARHDSWLAQQENTQRGAN